MTPREFLEQVVRPNVEELKASSSLRHAYNAVAAVDALAAHIFNWLRQHVPAAVATCKNDTEYRDLLARTHGDFALLRDLAKALKHVELMWGKPVVTAAAQMTSRQLGWGAPWGQKWGRHKQAVLHDNSGKLKLVTAVVGKALAVLEIEMVTHRI
jgi:hypothetical protein